MRPLHHREDPSRGGGGVGGVSGDRGPHGGAQTEGLGGGWELKEAKLKMAAAVHPEAAGRDGGPRASTPTGSVTPNVIAEPHPHLPGGGLASPSCVAADWLRLWSPVGFLTQGREEQARTRQVASAGPRMYACAVSSFWSPRRLRAPPSGLKGRALGGEWVSNLRILPSPSPFLWIGYTKLRNHFI